MLRQSHSPAGFVDPADLASDLAAPPEGPPEGPRAGAPRDGPESPREGPREGPAGPGPVFLAGAGPRAGPPGAGPRAGAPREAAGPCFFGGSRNAYFHEIILTLEVDQ